MAVALLDAKQLHVTPKVPAHSTIGNEICLRFVALSLRLASHTIEPSRPQYNFPTPGESLAHLKLPH